MAKLKNTTKISKIKGDLFVGKAKAGVNVQFNIPMPLAKILEGDYMGNEQKIALVKTYTEEIHDDAGKVVASNKISNQIAVVLIMLLEVGAL